MWQNDEGNYTLDSFAAHLGASLDEQTQVAVRKLWDGRETELENRRKELKGISDELAGKFREVKRLAEVKYADGMAEARAAGGLGAEAPIFFLPVLNQCVVQTLGTRAHRLSAEHNEDAMLVYANLIEDAPDVFKGFCVWVDIAGKTPNIDPLLGELELSYLRVEELPMIGTGLFYVFCATPAEGLGERQQ